MKRMPIAMTALALASLAACGPKGGGNMAASGGSVAPATSAPAADVAVNMADLPHPRAGLWQNTIDDGDGKPATDTSCLSGKTPTMPKMPPGCSQFSIRRTILGHYVMDMNCTTPRFTMVMHSEASGDFQNSMSSDATMSMTVAGQPPQTHKMHTEAHYVGPCAPGQKPDDVVDEPAGGAGATG
ncbi:MAG TPA: DUF3617 family protein [Caulobacteraceae bacterium]|jgi:hypothetical protein|nr:DUF3617 family protein [Caulobacteraceae bacterium]